jgi:hypothetical protein
MNTINYAERRIIYGSQFGDIKTTENLRPSDLELKSELDEYESGLLTIIPVTSL